MEPNTILPRQIVPFTYIKNTFSIYSNTIKVCVMRKGKTYNENNTNIENVLLRNVLVFVTRGSTDVGHEYVAKRCSALRICSIFPTDTAPINDL